MSTRSNNHKAIAVFGATGGCVLAFLIKALEGEHDCIALARTPSKLTGLLASNNVSSDLIQRHLTIVTGNVKDPESVTKTLFHSSLKSGVVDIIVSGVGGAPVFKASNLFYPTIDDPTICEGATTTVLNSLKANLKDNMKKPLAVVVSTTGISDHGRDIPIAMIPLYHWMLPVPHADKKKMETLLASEVKKSSPAISGFVVVRASLLSNGELRGVKKIRADIESDGKVAKSAIGYMISRKDVGNWIYETLVKGHNENESAYLNKFVGITN